VFVHAGAGVLPYLTYPTHMYTYYTRQAQTGGPTPDLT
jgi:hypothetical protein